MILLVIMMITSISLAMFIVVVCGFYIDYPWNRDDSAQMLELSPALIQTSLREPSVEAHHGTLGRVFQGPYFSVPDALDE